jgi:hypothetical protein
MGLYLQDSRNHFRPVLHTKPPTANNELHAHLI